MVHLNAVSELSIKTLDYTHKKWKTMIESEFLNKARFSKMVEEVVHKKRLSYIDAIVDLCDDTNIDPEDVGKFISNILKG
jgi:hypothetical protein